MFCPCGSFGIFRKHTATVQKKRRDHTPLPLLNCVQVSNFDSKSGDPDYIYLVFIILFLSKDSISGYAFHKDVIAPFHHFPCFVCENGTSWHRSCDAWTGVCSLSQPASFLSCPPHQETTLVVTCGMEAGSEGGREGRGWWVLTRQPAEWEHAASSRCVWGSYGGGAWAPGGGRRPRGQEQCELRRRPFWSICKVLGDTTQSCLCEEPRRVWVRCREEDLRLLRIAMGETYFHENCFQKVAGLEEGRSFRGMGSSHVGRRRLLADEVDASRCLS